MINTPLDTVLPRYVDPRKFAQQGVSLSGKFDLKSLGRLVPLLAAEEGEVYADLTFGIDDQGVRYISGQVTSQVSMICQRCLEPSPQDLVVTIGLGVVWSDEDAQQLSKSWDPLIAGEGQLDLYEVLEDELILGLPIVAYHEELCVPASHYSSSGDEEALSEQASDKSNPFQVLEQLKGSLH